MTQHVTVAWVASSLRLSQNIKLWDSFDTHSRERFTILFKRWKAIGQVASKKAKLLVRRKIPRNNVIQFVYRYGTHALEDWHAKLQSVVIPNSTRGDAVATLSLSARLKGEFLNRVVTPGQIFLFLQSMTIQGL